MGRWEYKPGWSGLRGAGGQEGSRHTALRSVPAEGNREMGGSWQGGGIKWVCVRCKDR